MKSCNIRSFWGAGKPAGERFMIQKNDLSDRHSVSRLPRLIEETFLRTMKQVWIFIVPIVSKYGSDKYRRLGRQTCLLYTSPSPRD